MQKVVPTGIVAGTLSWYLKSLLLIESLFLNLVSMYNFLNGKPVIVIYYSQEINYRTWYTYMAAPAQHKSTAYSIGNKVRQGVEIAGTLKGMYDIGSTIYRGARIVAPLLSGLLL
jgi:hypothetical protein